MSAAYLDIHKSVTAFIFESGTFTKRQRLRLDFCSKRQRQTFPQNQQMFNIPNCYSELPEATLANKQQQQQQANKKSLENAKCKFSATTTMTSQPTALQGGGVGVVWWKPIPEKPS